MANYSHEDFLWQHVLQEMESTINVAQQLIPLEQATMSDHNQVHGDTNNRSASLTLANVALHSRGMRKTHGYGHSVHSFSSFDWGQPAGRSRSYETISSEHAGRLQTIRLGPLTGPPCTQCMAFPAVCPRRIPRILCYRCLQAP